ncbi:hypothetical protein CR513_16011, partial [Mucuna pruriens]
MEFATSLKKLEKTSEIHHEHHGCLIRMRISWTIQEMERMLSQVQKHITLKPLSPKKINKDQLKMKFRREKEKKRMKGEERKKMRDKKERRTACNEQKGSDEAIVGTKGTIICWKAPKMSFPRTSHEDCHLLGYRTSDRFHYGMPNRAAYKANPDMSKKNSAIGEEVHRKRMGQGE